MSFTPEDYRTRAADLLATFNTSERHGVRFGLFPATKMTAPEQEGYDGRLLAVALMNLEKQTRRT
jgi:hypothetical protein